MVNRDLDRRPTRGTGPSHRHGKIDPAPSSCRRSIDRIPDWRGIWRSSRSVRPTATWWPSRSPTAGRCRPSGPPHDGGPRPQRHGVLFDAAAPESTLLVSWAARSWAEPVSHYPACAGPVRGRVRRYNVANRLLRMGHAVTWSTVGVRVARQPSGAVVHRLQACRPVVGRIRRSVRTGASSGFRHHRRTGGAGPTWLAPDHGRAVRCLALGVRLGPTTEHDLI